MLAFALQSKVTGNLMRLCVENNDGLLYRLIDSNTYPIFITANKDALNNLLLNPPKSIWRAELDYPYIPYDTSDLEVISLLITRNRVKGKNISTQYNEEQIEELLSE